MEILTPELGIVALAQIIQVHLFLLAFAAALHNLFGHLSVSFLGCFPDLPSAYSVSFAHFYRSHRCNCGGESFTPEIIAGDLGCEQVGIKCNVG